MTNQEAAGEPQYRADFTGVTGSAACSSRVRAPLMQPSNIRPLTQTTPRTLDHEDR